jgi:hypothetical protein
MGQAMAITGLASMNVQVGTGLVFIPNTTAWNGMYAGYNTATFNVAIAAASSTQYRSDYIAAQMTDPGDATANWNVVAVTGAFSSTSPGALPALPANSIPLAIIRVTPNMTVTNAGGTVVDARVLRGLDGVWPTTSASKPALTFPNGTMWYESDTHSLGVILNGAYQYLVDTSRSTSNDSWHAFNPLSNSWSVGSGGWAQYRWADDGRSIKISAYKLAPGTVTGGTVVSTNFPAGYRPLNTHEWPVSSDAINSGVAGRFTLSNAGSLAAWGIAAGATEVSFDVDVPLDL